MRTFAGVALGVIIVLAIVLSVALVPGDGAPVGVVPYPHPEMWRVP